MKRTSYDSSTRQYTFHDSTTGVQYISAPGERYGTLLPAATANYVKPKLGPGRKQTRTYFLYAPASPFPFLTHDQCKHTTVLCYSPTTAPRSHDPPLALPHEATRVPQTPPPPAAGIMDTDIRAAPPLQTSCLPVSSIAHPPPRRKKHRRPHPRRQNRRRRARSPTSICSRMLLRMRRSSPYRAIIPVIREGPVMRCARLRACSVARSRRSGATAHTDSGLMTVTCSCEQRRYILSSTLIRTLFPLKGY